MTTQQKLIQEEIKKMDEILHEVGFGYEEIMGQFQISLKRISDKSIDVSMLRQWLNENRITDPKKMVTNEDIMEFLK